MSHRTSMIALAASSLLCASCVSEPPAGLQKAPPARTTVTFDWFSKPLPTIPLPNDVATRYDATSPTKRRLNASLVADTDMEVLTRTLFDELDGWGVFSPITIPFTGPLDVNSIRRRHCAFAPEDTAGVHCAFETDRSDDAVYLIDVDPASPALGELVDLDIGHGHFPVVVEDIGGYWGNDPRGFTQSLFFDEADEDTNGNGRLDPGEDTDLDGVLDVPNYLPGLHPARDDLRGRADALMDFYERETNTLIVRPMMPLRERTRYAVVITRRVLDASGAPVGSPFPWVNDASQTRDLRELPKVLPAGLRLADVAFTFSFTTGTVEGDWRAVRDGLYGVGVQAHLGADFPAEVSGLDVVSPDPKKPYLLYGEEFTAAIALISSAFLGGDPSSVATQALLTSQNYVDYHVIGTYDSPQLFERVDADGARLPLDLQSWPNDLGTRPARARAEEVRFWLTVPRKEVSGRGAGEPVPIAILGHGYSSNRFEALQFGGFFAEYGIATLAIDCVSHGLGLSPAEQEQARTLLENFGLGPFITAVLKDRAFDQDGDGVKDSGADFWTGYLFHTRDVVRQSALDYMQLLRIVDSFDGVRTWPIDVDGDGNDDLAGDFDGDGHVDIGRGSLVSMVGGSLGGIMAGVVGGIEPKVDAIVPISGGGGLGDVGIRSKQGGVREAVILRIMGPVYVGKLDPATGALALGTVVPDLNDDAHVALGTVAGVSVGDTVVGYDLATGARGCGLVQPNGDVRLHVAENEGDRTRIEVYRGLAVPNGDGDCRLIEGAELVGALDTFEQDTTFQAKSFPAGTPLVALAEGIGRYRARPGLRRMLQLGQIALDRADPAAHAPFLQTRPITYAATGETTGAHALVITTMGDMNVPASSGLNMARAAGLIDYKRVDPRYGKTPDQVLIDTGAYEAVDTISRYRDAAGKPVHIDLEDFAGGEDIWTARGIPRLDPPLRLVAEDALCDAGGCGISGSLVPFPRPDGQHGFAFPGEQTDDARKACRAACEGSGCGCGALEPFDLGSYMFHLIAKYMASGGRELDFGRCLSGVACDGVPAPPDPRPLEALRE